MSNVQKEWWSKWAPLAVAIVTNLILVAYSYGKLEQRLNPLEKHQENAISRYEFTQSTTTRDRELQDVKSALRDMDAKLDRLLERQSRE